MEKLIRLRKTSVTLAVPPYRTFLAWVLTINGKSRAYASWRAAVSHYTKSECELRKEDHGN